MQLQSKLGKKLLRSVMLLYFIVAISLTALQLYAEINEESKQLGQEIIYVLKSFKPAFVHALWTIDNEQVMSILRGILNNKDIRKLEVEGQAGVNYLSLTADNQIVQYEQDDYKANNEEYDYSFKIDLVYKDGDEEIKVGKVSAYTSNSVVLRRSARTIVSTIIYALLKTFCLWFIFQYFVQRLIANPLGQLAGAANKLNPKKPDFKEHEDIKSLPKSDDEIGELISNFISMENALIHQYKTLLKYQKELEDRVSERTKELEKALAVKGEFLSNMSHEMRTPINGILGMAELLKDSELNVRQLKFVNTMESSGTALLSVINDVLDLSKLEAGKFNIEAIPFNILQLLEEITTVFTIPSSEKNISLVLNFHSNVPKAIIIDPTRLRQIVLNLLSNAFKFTNEGLVTIDVSLLEQAGNQNTIRITVSDTGMGINNENLNILFQPFVQAEISTARKYGGTGLGLNICKHLVELMGGEIGVESTLNQGSSFWFTVKANTANNLLESINKEYISIQDKKLLIIDSLTEFRDVVREFGSSWNMKVIEASNCSEARAILCKNSEQYQAIDVALMDINLPDGSGIEFAHELTSSEYQQIPLIVVSTAENHPMDSNLALTNIQTTLEKPILSLSLNHAIATSLDFLTQPKKKYKNSIIDKKLWRSMLNVIIAEDNIVNQMVIKGQLKKLGIIPKIVNDGLELVNCVKACDKPYDIILTDCDMPNLNGWAATKQIRSMDNKHKDTLIVGISAYALSSEKEKALATGMDDYLIKPISGKALVELFDKYKSRFLATNQNITYAE